MDTPSETNLQYFDVDDLHLDPKNPRLVTQARPAQQQLLQLLYEAESLDELAPSFAENGYFAEEPLVVVQEENEWRVVEGNRRLATLKLLLSDSLRAQIGVAGWPALSIRQRAALQRVPCVVYRTRAEVYPFLGFRHITGAKKWAPFQKARFITHLIDEGHSLSEIEDLIGDSSQTVKKLYQDHVVFEQIKSEIDIPEKRIRDRFSLLEVTLGQRSIKRYLGIPRSLPTAKTERLVPDDHLDRLEEVVGWVFGQESQPPVLLDSRAISNRLAPVLASEEATERLRKTRDLESAWEYSDGEKEFLLKKITSAERALREVGGILPVYSQDEQVRQGVDRLLKLCAGLKRQVDDE